MEQRPLTVLNWNVEWASPRSRRFPRIRARWDVHLPDVICVTEGRRSVLPDAGHVIASDADYGYPNEEGERRKVLLWSRHPWESIDPVGNDTLPVGRYVAGTTRGPFGPVCVHGVCIPWRDAHVRTGRKDRRVWEDHGLYLEGLEPLIQDSNRQHSIIVGDFNQTVPRTRAPRAQFERLQRTFSDWRIVTAGVRPETERPLIDHVAISNDLRVDEIEAWPRDDEVGRLSDHDGVAVRLLPVGNPAQP